MFLFLLVLPKSIYSLHCHEIFTYEEYFFETFASVIVIGRSFSNKNSWLFKNQIGHEQKFHDSVPNLYVNLIIFQIFTFTLTKFHKILKNEMRKNLYMKKCYKKKVKGTQNKNKSFNNLQTSRILKEENDLFFFRLLMLYGKQFLILTYR